jgi:4-diphosphocytidyl-2-C-methyl-D-erythritol kinase
VSTAEVFGTLARRENPPLGEPAQTGTVGEAVAWLEGCRNDLEEPARAIAPEIGVALDALRATEGSLLARMSGSGSACFAIYASRDEAIAAAAATSEQYPHWWCAATEAR